MTTTHRLSSTTRDDILAIPAIMLGFHPHDSCVVLMLRAEKVACCIRLPLTWHENNYASALFQVKRAARQVAADRFLIVGYGDRGRSAQSVRQMVAALGTGECQAFIVENERYWELGELGPGNGHDFGRTALAAQAVYAGISIQATRDEATAAVRRHLGMPPEQLNAVQEAAEALSDEQRLRRLEAVVEGEETGVAGALELSALLLHEECLAEILVRLGPATADQLWNRLVAARAVASEATQPIVLAVLSLASWLSGRAAAQTCCLEQLSGYRGHPVIDLARFIYQAALSPICWEAQPSPARRTRDR